MSMSPLKRYVDRLVGRNDERPLFRCTACGCTYSSNDDSCAECWNNRLVRIE